MGDTLEPLKSDFDLPSQPVTFKHLGWLVDFCSRVGDDEDVSGIFQRQGMDLLSRTVRGAP